MDLLSQKFSICLTLFVCCIPLSGKQSYNSDWFDSALRAEPITFDDLDGALISRFANKSTARPLIYPAVVPLHKWMDRTANTFYSLKQLAENPRLARIEKDRQFASSRKNMRMQEEQTPTFAQRQSKLFDPSDLLLPSETLSLPDDQELNNFLSAKANEFISPEKQVEIIKAMLQEESPDHPVLSLIQNLPQYSPNHTIPNKKVAKKVAKKPTFTVPEAPAVIVKKEEIPDTVESVPVASVPENTFLKLKARKVSRDGTMRPAQASEIYLTTQDLKELLKDLTKDPAISGEVRSVAELWAKAEKNVSRNPEIALGVKSILLSAKVGRARTDPYGQASLENLSPDDKYYLIGIDKDIETDVVTIRSKEVELAPGENLVELSSTDIIYQE